MSLFFSGRGEILSLQLNFYLVKSRKMISKWCIYHLVWVIDVEFKTPSLESVLVVNECLEVYIDDLLGIPPE